MNGCRSEGLVNLVYNFHAKNLAVKIALGVKIYSEIMKS